MESDIFDENNGADKINESQKEIELKLDNLFVPEKNSLKVPPEFKKIFDKMWKDFEPKKTPQFIAEEIVRANSDFISFFVLFEQIWRRNGEQAARRFIRTTHKTSKQIIGMIDVDAFKYQVERGKLTKYNVSEMVESFLEVIYRENE